MMPQLRQRRHHQLSAASIQRAPDSPSMRPSAPTNTTTRARTALGSVPPSVPTAAEMVQMMILSSRTSIRKSQRKSLQFSFVENLNKSVMARQMLKSASSFELVRLKKNQINMSNHQDSLIKLLQLVSLIAKHKMNELMTLVKAALNESEKATRLLPWFVMEEDEEQASRAASVVPEVEEDEDEVFLLQ